MNPEKETFFDKNTLIAVFLLGLCWIGWDSYMRKKYPSKPEDRPPVSVKQSSPLPVSPVAPSPAFRQDILPSETPEKTHTFAGEKISAVLSSRGMGFKEIRLKSFFDQKKQPVVFKEGREASLFAIGLVETGRPVPFQLKRQGEGFIGRYTSKELKITKTIQPDEENFAFDVRVEVSRFPPEFSGFRLFLRHTLPETLPEPWYSKLLFIAGRDISGGFVFSRQGEERFLAEELKEPKTYQTLSLLGLGNKYFGLALINRSDLLPAGVLKTSAKNLRGTLDYKPLTKAPFSLSWRIFCGPKSVEYLSKSDERLAGWINFGFFEWLARPLLKILRVFFKTAGNWGFAIVLLTFLVRLLLLPLNIRSYKSMKVMQKLQPQLQELRGKTQKKPSKTQSGNDGPDENPQSQPLRGMSSPYACSVSRFYRPLSGPWREYRALSGPLCSLDKGSQFARSLLHPSRPGRPDFVCSAKADPHECSPGPGPPFNGHAPCVFRLYAETARRSHAVYFCERTFRPCSAILFCSFQPRKRPFRPRPVRQAP